MDDVAEKRVFDARNGATELLVAADVGVLSVSISGARVGTFGVVHRCDPTDVAAADGLVAVGTGDGVIARLPGADGFEVVGPDPAVAVGVDDRRVIAAGPDGAVAWLRRDETGTDEAWEPLGSIDAAVRAIDGDLLAAADGVHRLPGLEYVGLDDATDVAAAGPLVATGSGLYSLGNGWMDECAGNFRVVATDGRRAHAVTPDALHARRDGVWEPVDLPVDGPVVDLVHGEATYAVTASGDLLAEDETGWRTTSLGVAGVAGAALA